MAGLEVEQRDINEVVAYVAEVMGVDSVELLAPTRRRRRVAEARMIGYWVLRHGLQMSLTEIARAFNRKCHRSVMSGLNRVDKTPALRNVAEPLAAAERAGQEARRRARLVSVAWARQQATVEPRGGVQG